MRKPRLERSRGKRQLGAGGRPAEPQATRVPESREPLWEEGCFPATSSLPHPPEELEVLQVFEGRAAANYAESKDLKIVQESTKTECENQIIWEAMPNLEKLQAGRGARKQNCGLGNNCRLIVCSAALCPLFFPVLFSLVKTLSGHLHLTSVKSDKQTALPGPELTVKRNPGTERAPSTSPCLRCLGLPYMQAE